MDPYPVYSYYRTGDFIANVTTNEIAYVDDDGIRDEFGNLIARWSDILGTTWTIFFDKQQPLTRAGRVQRW